jgi:O-antigen/teichoic acid export membrane protein
VEAPPEEAIPASRLGSQAVRNSLLVLGARVISRLVALVTVVVLANHLGDARYGRYVTMVAYSALVSVLADLGLNTLYTREAARDPERLGTFLATLLGGKAILGLLSFVVLAVALSLAGVGDLALPGGVLLIATTYSALLRNTFYALGRLEFEAIAILLEIAVQAGGIIAGARSGEDVAYFVWVYVASAVATAVFAAIVTSSERLAHLGVALDLPLLGRWLRLSFPFAVGFALTNLYFRADVPILQHFRPFKEVGWYQFAYKPFEALQFVPLAIQTVVYPVIAVFFRQAPGRVGPAYERFFKVLVLLGWPTTVGTFILVHPIGRIFRLFPESEPALRILSVGIVFLFANSAFTAMLYAVDRQDRFAWATAIAVVVNIGLNLVFIPIAGYLAASATTVITEAAFSIAGWAFVAKTYRLPWFRLSWRIILAGVYMGAVLLPFTRHSVYYAIPVGVLTYGATIIALRAVRRDELEMFIRGLRPRA